MSIFMFNFPSVHKENPKSNVFRLKERIAQLKTMHNLCESFVCASYICTHMFFVEIKIFCDDSFVAAMNLCRCHMLLLGICIFFTKQIEGRSYCTSASG